MYKKNVWTREYIIKVHESLFCDDGDRCGYEFCYRCGGKWTMNHGICQIRQQTFEDPLQLLHPSFTKFEFQLVGFVFWWDNLLSIEQWILGVMLLFLQIDNGLSMWCGRTMIWFLNGICFLRVVFSHLGLLRLFLEFIKSNYNIFIEKVSSMPLILSSHCFELQFYLCYI